MKMVEKVARALWDKDQEISSKFSNDLIFGKERTGKCVPWDFIIGPQVVPYFKELYLNKARAAIEAMKEPSVGMLTAGIKAADHPANIFPAMIEAALKEQCLSIQRSGDLFLALCDECDKPQELKATSPVSASRLLKRLGWETFDYLGDIRLRAYLWRCPRCKETCK